MADFKIAVAVSLMRKTAPFLAFRLAVYFGVAFAYVLVTGIGAGIGYGIGGFWGDESQLAGSAYGGLAGFGLTAAAMYLLREYLLYIVKAGHIAVMVELLLGRDIPQGQGQIGYARAMVTQRFGTSNLLFALDQLIKGVIGAVTRLLEGVFASLPIPGVAPLAALLRAYLRIAVGLLDEVILAQGFAAPHQDPRQTSRDALALYAQTAKPMLKNAVWVTGLVWALTLAVFFVMLAPAGLIVWLLPGQVSATGLVFAAVFAWAVKAAVIEPFALACMLQAYFALTAGQSPDPVWVARLDQASSKFKSLGQWATTATPRPHKTAGTSA